MWAKLRDWYIVVIRVCPDQRRLFFRLAPVLSIGCHSDGSR